VADTQEPDKCIARSHGNDKSKKSKKARKRRQGHKKIDHAPFPTVCNNITTTITTFNVENVKSNHQFIISDLQSSDILCTQEHHLYECQLETLQELLPEYTGIARGDDYLDNINPSRMPPGKGGVAILWKKHLSPHMIKSKLGNNRIVCVEYQSLFIVNVYMPSGAKKTKEFIENLDILESILASTPHKKSVLLTGDINIDLFKPKNRRDPRSIKMKRLLKKYQLYVLSCNENETYRGHMGHKSHLDIIATNNLDIVDESNTAARIHPFVPWNASTHTPVSVNVEIRHARRCKPKKSVKTKRITEWKTLNPTKYNTYIKNVHNSTNWSTMNQPQSMNAITIALHEAAHLSADTRISKLIIGIKPKKWNPQIQAATKKSKETYKQLLAAKETGTTDQIERLTALSKLSKREVRRTQRQAGAIKKNNLLNDISNSALTDSKKFNKLLKFNKFAQDLPPILIDDKLEYDETLCAKQWAKYHHDLATPMEMPNMDENHLSFIKKEVHTIRKMLQKDVSKFHVTIPDIEEAIKKLNLGKSADDSDTVAEHVMKAPYAPQLLKELYNKITDDESVCKELKTLIKISAPKKKKETHIQTNYRGIAISKLLLKILEHIIQVKSNIEEHTHDLQFGFTKARGPDMAALCLSESLNEAADLNILLTVVSLDTMKAFDMVDHNILLHRLYHLGIDPAIWKLIDSMLSGQTERAIWGSSISEPYLISQGTGQGKILGAPLFKVFIHPMLEQLSSLDLGFRIGNIPVGHPTCADDLLLISDSIHKAQSMCDAVQAISRQDRSTQQPAKSRVAFNKKNIDHCITLNEKQIPSEPFYTHVGINRYTASNDALIEDRTSTCRKTTYSLMPFGLHGTNGLSPVYIRKVIISHISPRTIHGIHTLTLTSKQRDSLDSAYVSILKNLQSLRKQTSNAAAYLLFGLIPLTAELDKRALTLFGSICRMKESSTLNQLARRQLATKTLSSRSWFIYVYKLGLQYGIDIISALDLKWSKQEWKSYIKHAVWSFHKHAIKTEAAEMTSLSNMNLQYASMKGCHSIWPRRKNKNKLDPICTKAASIRAKMLTSTYMLQTTIAKYYPGHNTPLCQLCMAEDETITHLLCKCKTLKKTRQKSARYLKKQLQKREILYPEDDKDIVRLILNGYETDEMINNACSSYCFLLHKKRYEILEEKGLLYRQKKKPKHKPDPKNQCIHCKKEVKDNQKAISCDCCNMWQHIKCNKIMDGWKYNRILKGTELFSWICERCPNPVQAAI